MKYDELNKLTPYRITKKSSDGTFLPDEIIWISDGGEVNSVHGGGFIYPEEGDSSTWDFEAEEAHDWEVIAINGHEFCRKRQPEKMSIEKNIKKYRKKKKMTQKELATLVGVNEVTIRSYEAEKYRPKIETIQKISSALGVPAYILDSRFEHMTNHEKLSHISQSTDSIDVSAVKSLLAKIQDDYEKGMFEQNSGQYLTFYRSMKEWLESEVEK